MGDLLLPSDRLQLRRTALRQGCGLHVQPRRDLRTVIPHSRASGRRSRKESGVAWAAAVALAAFMGLAAAARLRADSKSPAANVADRVFIEALGAPTGVLAVLNPVNCSLGAGDAAALNALAAIPGVRVTVLLLAVAPHDSVLQRVRADFSFSSAVSLQSASQFDPRRLPPIFRQPFVAVMKRGQLRHAAWGESIKSLSSWIPQVVGSFIAQPVTPTDSLT
jgi:hypothetical protein